MFAIASTAGLRAPTTGRSARAAGRLSTRRAGVVRAHVSEPERVAPLSGRREVFGKGAALAAFACFVATTDATPTFADSLPEETDVKLICDEACELALLDAELITTKSGLQYREIVVGTGMQPEPGFQVVVDYIAKNEQGFIFDNSLEKGKPNDVRVTGDPRSSLVIPGLDEGILTMKSGGIRRMYIPGELAFPKGLASAPGRPRIPPFSKVVFDVKLIYIPGME
jgi:peptidylprolyl isomerase